jgi:exopolysaccharide biosynthesis polyprenyl glycosylphosphotransferase
MLRSRAKRFQKLLLALDVALAATGLAAALRLTGVPPRALVDHVESLLLVAVLGVAIWPLSLDALGLYESQRRRSMLQVTWRIGVALVLAGVVLKLAVAVTLPTVGPAFAAVAVALQFALIATSRIAIHGGLRVARMRGRNYRHVLIVGSGPRARLAADLIEEHPAWGQRLVGLLDDCDTPADPALIGVPIHKLQDLPDLMRRVVIDEVIVACPRSMLSAIAPAIATCAAVGIPVTMLSDVFGDLMPRPRVAEFGMQPALSFGVVHHSRSALLFKRVMDVICATALLLLLSPVLAIAAIATKLDSKGPVLFRQKRCGLNGRLFDVLKLRSMHVDAETRRAELALQNEMDGPVFKIRNDPRITRVGRLLRRLSIDELPQLWNVVRGEMSLVGPRPPIPGEVDEYDVAQRRRLSMRPGITCLWQVEGRNTIGFTEWVQLDLNYIDRWSLLLDIKILLRTLPAVLKGTGAS